MNNILLVHNREYFDNAGMIQLPMRNHPCDIPDRSSILFLGSYDKGTDHIHDDLVHTLQSISCKPYVYIILIGKTDDTIRRDIIIPKNIARIYANNIDYDHPYIRFFPMGRDFRSIAQFSMQPTSCTRDTLCYCNYSLNTHPSRTIIYNHLKEKSFVLFEHMGEFLDYNVSRGTFFERLYTSKFTICPRGNALDTFRFYDAFYCGCIPIVVRSHHHQYFEELPVLFLEDERDFAALTEEFLEEQYTLLSKRKRTYYPELDMDYWTNILFNDLIVSEINLCVL